uniref:Uncharacterized protein n=1 Tax=Myotis myotis TaxID=51298 RepID=A0A7J7QX98_MYOMY|nr:hypothetical protein mMyoMyo1_011281 [Myotis myotis]
MQVAVWPVGAALLSSAGFVGPERSKVGRFYRTRPCHGLLTLRQAAGSRAERGRAGLLTPHVVLCSGRSPPPRPWWHRKGSQRGLSGGQRGPNKAFSLESAPRVWTRFSQRSAYSAPGAVLGAGPGGDPGRCVPRLPSHIGNGGDRRPFLPQSSCL